MKREILKNRQPVSFFSTESFTMAEEIVNSTPDEMSQFRDSTAEPEFYKVLVVPEKPVVPNNA